MTQADWTIVVVYMLGLLGVGAWAAPLQTTRMCREFGMRGNWFYWEMILSHIGVASFFALLWRRTGVITDAHFTQLNSSASALRGSMCVSAMA